MCGDPGPPHKSCVGGYTSLCSLLTAMHKSVNYCRPSYSNPLGENSRKGLGVHCLVLKAQNPRQRESLASVVEPMAVKFDGRFDTTAAGARVNEWTTANENKALLIC